MTPFSVVRVTTDMIRARGWRAVTRGRSRRKRTAAYASDHLPILRVLPPTRPGRHPPAALRHGLGATAQGSTVAGADRNERAFVSAPSTSPMHHPLAARTPRTTRGLRGPCLDGDPLRELAHGLHIEARPFGDLLRVVAEHQPDDRGVARGCPAAARLGGSLRPARSSTGTGVRPSPGRPSGAAQYGNFSRSRISAMC